MASNFNSNPIVFANQASGTTPGVIQLTGDLGGTYLSPLVTKLRGAAISAVAGTTGQTLIVQSDGTLAWGTSVKRVVNGTYASSFAPNIATTDILRITLTGNLTLANPTGTPVDKQTLQVELTQDATGSRTITFGTAYAFSTDIPSPTLSTGANKADIMLFQYDNASAKWRLVGLIKGF